MGATDGFKNIPLSSLASKRVTGVPMRLSYSLAGVSSDGGSKDYRTLRQKAKHFMKSNELFALHHPKGTRFLAVERCISRHCSSAPYPYTSPRTLPPCAM